MPRPSGHPTLRRTVLTLLPSLAVCALLLALYLLQPPLLRQLDNEIYDLFLTSRQAPPPSDVPVVVDIDEKSLTAYGQWPWPRYLLARLIETLTQNGAACVALDILLAEPDRSSPDLLRRRLRKDFGVELDLGKLPPELADNDVLLAETLARNPVVLGVFMQFDPYKNLPSPLPRPTGLAEQTPAGAPPPRETVMRAVSALLPLAVFSRETPVGAINVAPSNDGVVREVPLLYRLGDNIYANLSLRALMHGLDAGTMILRSGPEGLTEIRVGPYRIPVSAQGLMRVPFKGPRGVYPYYSAADILERRVPPEQLEGRIVFVGTSAAGLQDIRATPFDAVYPGVEVHAAVVDAILNGDYIARPDYTPGIQTLAILLAGLAAAAVFNFTRAFIYGPACLLLAGCALWGSGHLFAQGQFISPLYVILTILAQGLCILPVRFWQEEKQKRMLRQAFSRYVAPEVVARIAAREGDIFAGEEREVSVLFTDVRGFTSLSEKLAPQQVVTLLNRYFTPMTACVRDSGGTLDKFIGDAIMAFWNAPLDVPDHARRAVTAAVRMQHLLRELNPALEKEFGVRLRIGAGLHCGPVYVGNMGSEDLLDYTCIGDTVNLASRLEGICAKYGAEVVVSGDMAARCDAAFYFRALDSIRVKGKSRPVSIFSVHEPEEARRREAEFATTAEALRLYAQGDFAEAGRLFDGLRESSRESTVFYEVYSSRCAALCANPPEVWDGIWTFNSK